MTAARFLAAGAALILAIVAATQLAIVARLVATVCRDVRLLLADLERISRLDAELNRLSGQEAL